MNDGATATPQAPPAAAADADADADAPRPRPRRKPKLKHRWAVTHNYLAGVTFGDWWRLLRDNRFAVDGAYLHRAAFVTFVSLMNSYFRRKEERRFGDAIERTAVERPPLFILGHWRSGTTHLHYLLARDAAQFSFPNTYQVVSPHTFLLTEEKNTRRFAGLVPSKRPMDNMEMSFHVPQEDELALALLCFKSLYLGVTFPRHTQYERYLTFEGAAAEDVEAFKRAFVWFCKKLTLKHGQGRALLIKSPPHTARVRLLLEMFPDARFVHIHRNPYDVFQSFRHYYDTAMWYTYLQRPDLDAVDGLILDRYVALHDAYFAQRSLVPPGRLVDVRYEELERDPMGQVGMIYDRLDLGGFEQFRPTLSAYVASLKDYKKNRHRELPEHDKRMVAERWRRSFEEWNYPV